TRFSRDWSSDVCSSDLFIQKKAKAEADFDRRISAVPEENTRKINNLEFRKQRKLSRIEDKIQNGNTVMQWGEPLSILDTTNVRQIGERRVGKASRYRWE